jgi:hypothetical protein
MTRPRPVSQIGITTVCGGKHIEMSLLRALLDLIKHHLISEFRDVMDIVSSMEDKWTVIQAFENRGLPDMNPRPVVSKPICEMLPALGFEGEA